MDLHDTEDYQNIQFQKELHDLYEKYEKLVPVKRLCETGMQRILAIRAIDAIKFYQAHTGF